MKFKGLSVGMLSLLFLASCGNKGMDMSNQALREYQTMTLTEQSTVLQSVYPVTIRGQEDIDIKPRIDGFIDAIYIDEGSVVTRGQVLFKINSPQSEQAYTAAKAAVSSAEAQFNTAKLNVERMRPLADKGIISNVQLKMTIDSYESANAALAQAKASFINAQESLNWTNVTSPVNGVIGSIPYRLGSLVNSSTVLTTVANTGTVFAQFSLNERELTDFLNTIEGNTQAEKIKNMPLVSLIQSDGNVYSEKGRIETITGSMNITTGSASLRAVFPNPQGVLRSGTSGRVSIPRNLDNIFLIPQKATFSQQDRTLVYKVEGDSVVQRIITVLPTPDGRNFAVLTGLSEGDRIVSDGISTLSNGMRIKVK